MEMAAASIDISLPGEILCFGLVVEYVIPDTWMDEVPDDDGYDESPVIGPRSMLSNC